MSANGKPSPKPRKRKAKRWLVLEVVQTIEAATFEEVQERVNSTFPETRSFLIEELK